MKKIILCCIVAVCSIPAFSQNNAQQSFRKNGYQLIFKCNYNQFDSSLKNRLVETFFVVYPALAKEFNPTTLKEVIFFIDTAYDGVAATANGVVTFNPAWFIKHPGDIDVVTHEVMHIVQNYGHSGGPGWLTEGIADYVRYKFGVDNAGAGWSLPALQPNHRYENSYRVTARFFAWIEKNIKAGTIKLVDESLRNHSYKESLWKELTGKNLNELWADYIQHPSLEK